MFNDSGYSYLKVICDDFNLEFGKIRYRLNGSAGGNNGLKSIIASLGTDEFPRLRIGTGNDELRKKLGDVDFVLSKFTPEEKEKQESQLYTYLLQYIGNNIRSSGKPFVSDFIQENLAMSPISEYVEKIIEIIKLHNHLKSF